MIPGNRNVYSIFTYNGLIYSEWGAQNIFSTHRGALQTIIEKHSSISQGTLVHSLVPNRRVSWNMREWLENDQGCYRRGLGFLYMKMTKDVIEETMVSCI